MGDENKNRFAYCFSTTSSSTIKLLFFIVPLILVSFFVFVLVPRNSTWVLISSLPSSSSAAAQNSSEKFGAATHAEGSEEVLDLRSRVGTTVDVHSNFGEAALSDEAAFNRSSSPPLAVETVIKIHELVSDFSFMQFSFVVSVLFFPLFLSRLDSSIEI